MKYAHAFGILFASILCSSALAQEIGTRLKHFDPAKMTDRGDLSDVQNSRYTLAKFSDCVIQRDRNEALVYLAMDSESQSAMSLSRKILSYECLRTEAGGTLKIPRSVVRAGLFGALYRADFGRREGVLAEQPIDYGKDAGATAADYIPLREFAECVVRADPANSRTVVMAYAGTSEDKSAFSALAPQFGPCLPQGSKVTFSKTIISGLIAEVLYRLSSRQASAS